MAEAKFDVIFDPSKPSASAAPDQGVAFDVIAEPGQSRDISLPRPSVIKTGIPSLDKVGDFLSGLTDQAVGQGMLFGFGDELRAAIDTAVDRAFGRKNSFSNFLEIQRTKEKQFSRDNPIASTAGQIAGSVVSLPVLGAGAALALPKLAARPVLSTLGGATALGALQGFGEGEGGVENRLKSAGIGAGLGAGTAGTLGILSGLARIAGNVTTNLVRPEKAAGRAISGAAEADVLTPQRMKARLKSLGPKATIADVGTAGGNIQGLARGVSSVPGPQKARANVILGGRAQTEASRLRSKINETLEPQDFFSSEEKFLKQLGDDAAEDYAKAYQAGDTLRSSELSSLLDRVPKTAWNDAKRIAIISGKPIAAIEQARLSVGTSNAARIISTQTINDIKIGLDQAISNETNELTGKQNRVGRELIDLKNKILTETDRLNPEYKIARKRYGGTAEVIESLREGREFFSLDPEQITKKLSTLSEAAKKAYRSGATREIFDIIDKTPDSASAARRIFGNPILRKKLRALLPDQKSFVSLARAIVPEMRFAQTKANILSGSQTQPRIAKEEGIKRVFGTLGALTGARIPGEALVTAGMGRLAGRSLAGKFFPEKEAIIGRLLLNPNPEANAALLDLLSQAAVKTGNRPLNRLLLSLAAKEAAEIQ